MSPDSKARVEALRYFDIMGQSRSYDIHIQSQSEMIKFRLCEDQKISISFRHTNPKVTWKNTIMSIILVVSWVWDKSKNTIDAQSIQSRLYTYEMGEEMHHKHISSCYLSKLFQRNDQEIKWEIIL